MKSKLVFLNQCFDKTRLRNLISWVLFTKGEKRTIETIEKLKDLGFNYATRAGISLSVDDLKIPFEKVALVSQAKQQVSLADREYEKGNVTSIEKLQQLVDTWHRTSETLKQTVVSNFQATDKLSPVYMMAFSGARGNISQVRQLAGMRGLMADPQGQIIGFPIRSNFREGLTLTEYMISCYGARKGLVDTALRTADAGYLTRRLVDVSQHMVVTASTCATRKGVVLSDLAISGKPALSLRDRLVGRVLAEDVYSTNPLTEALVRRQDLTKVGKRNQEISATLASQIAANHKKVTVRSPLTCSIRHGVCQLCYGWSLSEGRLVNLGEAVGIIAAQSIGEPGTQLTMRTFHTGGVFSGDVMTEIRAPYEGTIHFRTPLQGLLIRTSHGKIAFLTKSAGELILSRKKTPSMTRDSLAQPFPFLSKTEEPTPRQTAQSTSEDDIEKLFTLETSTVVFVRQHEKVSRTQLIAEYSSMGTEINETIEAKRTLFANNAGQISFTNSLIRSEIQGNGNIIRTSQTLGSVWILSGKKPSPLMLLDILEKGTHIVNQNTIIARVPCPNVDLSSRIIPDVPLKVTGTEVPLRGPGVANEPLRSSKNEKGVALSHFLQKRINEGVDTRILSNDGRNFLPSILSSSINTKSSINHYNQSLSLPSRSSVFYKNGKGANEPLFRPINNFSSEKVFRASTILTDPTFSALCIQPYVSNYPRTIRSKGNQKSYTKLGRMWIFSPLYKTTRNGIAWFDTRFLNKNLNLGEVIWVGGEPVGLSALTTRWEHKKQRRPVNPLVGQPSSNININLECKAWNFTTDLNISQSFVKARNFFFKQGKTRNNKQSSSIKTWIVTFEKNQNVTKEKALRLQSDHFIVASPAVSLAEGSLVTPSVAGGGQRTPSIIHFDTKCKGGGQQTLLSKNKRFSWERQNSTKEQEPLVLGGAPTPKSSVSSYTENRPEYLSCWVYCPQQVKKVSALHESIDFYRNRQVNNLTFDSSIVYLKARYNLGLVYDYQKHLELMAFLFLKGDTSRIPGISGWRPKFFTPYLNSFTSTFQDTNRQYSAVYLSKRSDVKQKLVLHFAGPQTEINAKREKGSSANARKTRDFSSGVILQPQVNGLKKGGLLFLRKWMQIPQSCALHERLVSLEKNFSFSDSEDPMEPYKICQQKITDEEEIATSVIPTTIFSTSQPSRSSVFEKNGKGVAKTNLQRVKIELRKGTALLFDTRNCFYSSFVDKNRGFVGHPLSVFFKNGRSRGSASENDKTERYKRLVWKNLINCKPFLLLRTCQLQVQIVSNTKARHLLSLPVNHPLTWHSLVHSSNLRKSWHKKENSTNFSLVSRQDLKSQAACFHQLNLRQQILPLRSDRTQSFFDFISNLESERLQIANPQLQAKCNNLYSPVEWPYSSQAKILALISKGLSVPLPSRKTLTSSYKAQSSICLHGERENFSPDPRISTPSMARGGQRTPSFDKKYKGGVGSTGMKESALDQGTQARPYPRENPFLIHYTFQFRFVTKVKVSLLITKCKPNKLLLLPLLLTKDFATRVVSANSYLVRFVGSAEVNSHRALASRKRNQIFSPVKGEMISQDTTQLKNSFSEGYFAQLEGRGGPRPQKGNSEADSYFACKVNSEGQFHSSNTLLLTEEDQISMSLSEQKTNIFVGQFLTLGEEFIPNYAALASGEVIAIERNKITLRQSQGSLFYPNGVIHVTKGQWINKNAPILTLTYQKLVTGDIVQGIPKIEQFFEAPATRDGEPFPNSLQSILRNTYQQLKRKNSLQAVKQSMSQIQQILVEGILRVYLSQGVRIADKHLEVVIRQMTSKGQILHVGNTGLFQGEFVNLDRIERINLGTYGQKADYEPSVLGITQASLGSDSFISAASFQETTRVLSRDTIVGKTDFLRGLKERVVLGDVIQAGTGLDDNINYGLRVTST